MTMNQQSQSEPSIATEPDSAGQSHPNTTSPDETLEHPHGIALHEELNAAREPAADAAVETSTSVEMTSIESNEPVNAEVEVTPSVEELKRQLAEVTQTAANHWDTLLRNRAEYDNLQKRMTRDLDNARKYALEKFATELLAIKDSMELGLDAIAKPETTLDTVREGMVLTAKMFTDVMAKFNILEINPHNQKFDPQWHEAIAMQPIANIAAGTVLHVQQKGYQLNDRLLRPARVIVAKVLETEKSLENQG